MAENTEPQEVHDTTRNWLLGGLLLCAVLTLIAVAAPVATPILMAAFLASVLRSPVRALLRFNVPRPLAAAAVFLGFLATLIILVVTLYEPASRWIGEVPNVITEIERNLTPIRDTIEEAQNTAERLEKATELSGAAVVEPVRVKQASLLEQVFETSRVFLAQVAVTLVLVLFMLAFSAPLLPTAVTDKMGDRGRRLRESLDEIEVQMSRYMGALALVNLVVGLLTAGGVDLETSATASIATLGNIGPGLHAVGPTGNFAAFAPFQKLIMVLLMWLGRLEVYAIASLFAVSFWRR